MAQRAPGQGLSRRAALAGLAGVTSGAIVGGLACHVPRDMSKQTGTSGQAPDFANFAGLAGFCDGVPAIADAERGQRRARAQDALRAAGQHALVAEAGATLEYFTGVPWHRSERPLLLVLPAAGPPALVGPSFEAHTLRERSGELRLVLWSEHASPYARVAELLAETGAPAPSLALEPTTRMFVLEGLRRDVPAATLVDGGPIVRACRSVKSPAELALLRRANEATKAALRQVASRVRADMLEAELTELVLAAQLAAGLEQPWALVLFGSNAALPHGTRGARRLSRGELVLVDCGAALHGYHSDVTRTWPFGQVSPEARHAWQAVLRAQTAGIAELRPGQPCGVADAAARAVITAAGFGPDDRFFTHRLGHGIGLETHEDPYLVRDSQVLLAPGMTMSSEPGIYVPGKFGVRIEDIVAVTPTGATGAEVFGPRSVSLDDPFGA